MAAIERPQPASARPSFSFEQVKATGGQLVYEWAVHVPVCDEYDTAESAFEATIAFSKRMHDAERSMLEIAPPDEVEF